MHVRTDVNVPAPHVPTRPRVDHRLLHPDEVSGKPELARQALGDRRRHGDGREGCVVRRHLGELGTRIQARQVPCQESDDDRPHGDRRGDHPPAATTTRGKRRRRGRHDGPPVSSSGSRGRGGWRRSRLYMTGTNKSVETVASRRPPMTARASGAFCSPPSPMPSDIGSIPSTIASAVISTGRMRVRPAATAALRASSPASRRWFAKVTMRMLFAVDRKSTRLNSSHGYISYAVFCLKKKKIRTEVK